MASEGREGTVTYPNFASSDSSGESTSSESLAASSSSQHDPSPSRTGLVLSPSSTEAAGPANPPWNDGDAAGFPSQGHDHPSTRTGDAAASERSSDNWPGVASATQSPSAPSPSVIDPSAPPRDSFMEFTASQNLSRAARTAAALPPTPQTPQRSEQEIVLPRWQPDAEATYCPICHTQFSIFIRKHHCRKCGRVVCGSCSPHRIIIPYQYIVRPPNAPAYQQPAAVVAAAAGGVARRGSGLDTGAADSLSLGGGERVRLCNPCVPDPNTAPPHSPAATGAPSSNTLPRSHSQSLGNHGAGSNSNSLSLQRPLPPVHHTGHLPGFLGTFASTFGSAPEQQGTSLYGSGSSNAANGSGGLALAGAGVQAAMGAAGRTSLLTEYMGSGGRYPYNSHGSRRAGSGSGGQLPTRYQDQLVFQTRGAAQQREQEQEQAQSRAREQARALVREEDECPVCRRELPSASLPNAEALRETHISQCIEAFSGGGRRSHSHSGTSGPSGGSGTGSGSGSSMLHPSSPPLPPPPPRGTGMFPYKATEKDCVDDAECTICLEEFVVGVPMARLECFCRFHESCIRLWFQTRPGRCPVHQHDGYGF